MSCACAPGPRSKRRRHRPAPLLPCVLRSRQKIRPSLFLGCASTARGCANGAAIGATDSAGDRPLSLSWSPFENRPRAGWDIYSLNRGEGGGVNRPKKLSQKWGAFKACEVSLTLLVERVFGLRFNDQRKCNRRWLAPMPLPPPLDASSPAPRRTGATRRRRGTPGPPLRAAYILASCAGLVGGGERMDARGAARGGSQKSVLTPPLARRIHRLARGSQL